MGLFSFTRASYNGYLTPAVGSTYLYALGGLALGVMAGNWAFRHIPNKLFTYIVYAYIGISGLVILVVLYSLAINYPKY